MRWRSDMWVPVAWLALLFGGPAIIVWLGE
jgi:hypothetical protein